MTGGTPNGGPERRPCGCDGREPGADERDLSTPEPVASTLTRRGFLQRAGLASAGLAVGSSSAKTRHPARRRVSHQARGSDFALVFEDGAITSLRYAHDRVDTEYVEPGGRLGDVVVRYRSGEGAWSTLASADAATDRKVRSRARAYGMSVGTGSGTPEVDVGFAVEPSALRWTVTVRNPTARPLEIGDLAVGLPIDLNRRQENDEWVSPPLMRHGLVAGDSSFFYWMRSGDGHSLVMTVDEGTSLEYWEGGRGDHQVFVHSAASGAMAREEHGTTWRQPNTGLTLEPGGAKTYAFTLRWADDRDEIRRILVEQGLVDVHVIPGMTVPRDLFVRLALRTRDGVHSLEAEFPDQTEVRSLGSQGDTQIYEVQFERLGENLLTVHFGQDRRMVLEFFSTEPLETLIQKRAAFIAAHQVRDPDKWYDGLLTEWAMDTHVMPTPDNHDRIEGWRIYQITCDDGGLGKPAFVAAKNAEYPVQEEVDALDYYIEHFVWGGLQMTTEETFPYAIYGIPDWHTNRHSDNPGRTGRQHLWRIYDYPHIALMYLGMYRVARNHPDVRTALSAEEYLRRAWGTSVALFTIPWEIERWPALRTGLMNGPVVEEVIDALYAEGMTDAAERLRAHWERKVRTFVLDRPDIFKCEYSFCSTGFEGTHGLARHALRVAEPGPLPERTVRVGWIDYAPSDKIPLADAREFMETQMRANLLMRGWIETSYYLLGSGNAHSIGYMNQMGGWAVLDYALHEAVDPQPYLRLGYASYLSGWALVNSGTPESNYGYWYPGPENDGASAGGLETEPYGETWLGQPHHRWAWYYSGEMDLGYCAGLRTARTVLADDPLFGRFCYGGDWRSVRGGLAVTPKDGVRRRFHAMLDAGRLHLESEVDRFAAGQEIVLAADLSQIRFQLESGNARPHTARLRLSGLPAGVYEVRREGQRPQRFSVIDEWPTAVEVHVAGRDGNGPVTIARTTV